MSEPEQYLAVATIRRPHGVRGELLLAVETDRPDSVFRVGRELLIGDPAGRPTEGKLTVRRVRRMPDALLLQADELTGLTDAVQALRGKTLLIPVSQAAPVAGDEVHYRDLPGMAVLVGEEEIGRIREVQEMPGALMLIVRRPGKPDAMVPFVRGIVRSTDRAARTVTIDPPEGLLEL